jgi:translocation and assembly module TamA
MSCGPLSAAETPTKLEVAVVGVKGPVLENVLANLSVEKHKDHPHLTTALIRRLHRRADDEIRKALQPFGYYRPTIDPELKQREGVWLAKYSVDAGEQVAIANMEVQITGPGADDPNMGKLVAEFPMKKGEPLLHGQYEKAKRTLQRAAFNYGYLDARLTTHKVEVSPAKNEAFIMLHLDTGPRYFFGAVTFKQEAFHEDFLNRFLPFDAGAPYSQQQLFELQHALYDGGYFSEVEVRPRKDQTDALQVPIEVSLVPRKRQQYTFGIGFGTDSGVRGSLGWESRRINSWGHRMDAALRVSQIRQSLTTQYIVPLENPVLENRTFTAGWLEEDTDTSESETFLLGVSHHHLRRKWRETLYLNYQNERFDVGEDEGRSQLLLPGIRWVRVTADNRIYASRGGRLLLDIKGAHENLLSDTTFLQLRIMAKLIKGLGNFGRIIARGEAGTSLVSEFSELPASLRFFAGGDQSVRGYDYQELGPTDGNGEVIGGEHLLVGSIEYEQKLVNKWSAALFFDVGNGLDDWSDRLKKGAGFGIRWLSPVGPVRIDLASALDKSGDPWRLHFVVGPDL